MEDDVERDFPLRTVRYEGVLESWFETGTEGMVWVLACDTRDAKWLLYDNLFILEEGDELTVWAPDGAVLFKGVLEFDRETGWVPYPRGQWPPEFRRRFSPPHWALYYFRRWCANHWHGLPGWLKGLMRSGMSGQQAALGCWIHWVQKGWDADAWAELFMPPSGQPSRRARVVARRHRDPGEDA